MKLRFDRIYNSELLVGILTGIICFLAYFCMYMYRKPYTAGVYDGLLWNGIDYKISLVIAQVLGYAISKFAGIRIISSLKLSHRIPLFLTLMGFAFLSLVGFAFTDMKYGPYWLFLNGLPLGLIWGIVFTYCEGKRLTELITVILAANFIITSGIAKSLGRMIISWGIAEQSMPMYVGIIIIPLMLLSVWLLSKIPAANDEERSLKVARVPMTGSDRINFLKYSWLPVILLVLIYLILTIIRDIRDNFAVEIWMGLGYSENNEIYTTTELPVTIIVLIGLGLLYRIRNNLTALMSNILISLLGIGLLLSFTLLISQSLISGVSWMIISGIGLFLPYILFNGIIFDRYIAHYRVDGNVGFVMYIADAVGYLGSIAIMLYKNFGETDLEWLSFYTSLSIYGSLFIILLLIILGIYFLRKKKI